MAGYKEWIENAEVKIDYFSAFLKAWIAFNAWYNEEIHEKTDQQCIEKICDDSRFKSYITNLLAAEDNEAVSFKNNLAKLHETLNSSPIKSQEYLGVKQDISFSKVLTKNKNSDHHFEYRSIKYKCSKSHGKLTTVVLNTKSGVELLRYEQDEWDIDALKQQTDYFTLTLERKTKCAECYNEMIPYKESSVLSSTENEKLGTKIGTYLFIKDYDKIAEAIIKILYMLRCCLAHGDISPDRKTSDVYRYAYEVLLTPLLKLK